jgi:hypothetical protein
VRAKTLCSQGDAQSPIPFPVAIPSSTPIRFFNPQQEDLFELVFAGLVIVRALELVGAWWLS